MQSFGIIGFGKFSQFLVEYIKPHGKIQVYDPHVEEATDSLEDVCNNDFLIFAVPAHFLEDVAEQASKCTPSSTHIIDVTSVKVKPLEILKKHFPHNPILGTHPIFGPQSGKDGIAGLPIVLSNASFDSESYSAVKNFCESVLQLKVVEKTPDEHDREMAYIMGLSHFIGRALKHMDIHDYETNTFSYHQLVELRDLLKYDSWELFEAIQCENKYATEVREKFLAELHAIEKRLHL